MENRLVFFVFIMLTFIGCSKEKKIHSRSDFEAYINSLPLVEISKVESFNKSLSQNINSPLRLSINQNGKMIVIDDSNWSLHMLTASGKIINSIGGIGNGPAEFLQINKIFVDNNERLYAYDAKLKRITKFDLTEEGFEFINVVNLPEYKSLHLKSLYINENRRIGVFNKHFNRSTENNKKVFYRLKNNFELDTKITSIPGNEKIMVRNYKYDNPLGKMTFWDIESDVLYYAHNKAFTVHSFNLRNKQKQTLEFTNEPVFKSTPETQSYLKEFFSPLQRVYPNFDQLMEETESLPLFIWFKVHKDNVYFSLFNPSKKKGRLLRMNLQSGKLYTIKVPKRFILYDVYENKLFGINHETNKVAVIKLDEPGSG